MLNADLSLTFRTAPEPLADGSPASAGLTAFEPFALNIREGEVFYHRIIRREHVNQLYNSAPVDNAIEVGTFPGFTDAGSSTTVKDWEGQPIQLTTIRLIAIRVQPLVAYVPAFATTTLTSENTAPGATTTVAPINGDTVTIGAKTYTFRTTLTPTEGEVLIGANAGAALLNLIRAINYTGTPGTHYSCAAAHPTVGVDASVTTLSATALYIRLTALTGGPAGNELVSTTASTSLTFPAATLSGGAASAIPLTPQPFGGTVTVALLDGVVPGGATAESIIIFDQPGYHITAMDGAWTPEAASKIIVAFDAPSPGLPSEVNAIATLLIIGN